ncbi:MAG: hypothetical protein Q9201_001887 [Fulgogasparrea decipioides]
MGSPTSPSNLLDERDVLTRQLFERPYSSFTYIERAWCYEELGYPDLAVGDAYRALLLTDELSDDSGEYHEGALETFCEDIRLRLNGSGSLEFERGHQASSPTDLEFILARRRILKAYNTTLLEKDPNWKDWNYNPKTELPGQGRARRELYPWNDHEPDRFSKESLQFLNERMKMIAPKCEVRATSLPVLETKSSTNDSLKPSATSLQLGVFATADIAPYETVLQETSILTANNRLHDPLCDACSAPLPPTSLSDPPLPSCLECEDIVFCSQSCHGLAMSLYHPAICGKPDLEAIAKDPSPSAATNALYLLLLGRTFAMSETQKVHPLDLPETKYLWGDFSPPAAFDYATSTLQHEGGKKLPFTFEDNVLAPLHLLQKMDIDIFASLPTTDTWIISTLFAKFRGVASARMNPRTGMPEVCAAHPMWCLANHSCAPNVKWEWGGDIKFEARGGEEVVRWGGMSGGREGGIRKGDEVLNHYCDVGLGLEERREWAVGALGGICMCERCVWEEVEEEKKRGLVGRKGNGEEEGRAG